jgi:2-polyprenyl-3-methyl-5-hydroxy-6-metoxy-1,4-benzoquinol methylase
MNNCIVCKNDTIDFMSSYDDRHGYPGIFKIDRCRNCGHKTLKAEFAPEELTSLYTDYYPRSAFDIDKYQSYGEVKGFTAWLNGVYSSAFRWVPENVRILDIGCGFGESLGYHKARGCDVYGVEADENIRRVADKYGYKVHIGLFDPNIYDLDFFDYVTMDQVIEHVLNPVETLSDISKVIKPGGVLILGTPNSNGWGANMFGDRWVHWHTPYHLQLFSKKSMSLAAERARLTVEKVETITSSDWLYFQWIHLLTRPKIGEVSVFWTPNVKRTLVHEKAITFLNLLHYMKINHVLTRIFDALGIGDNYLFFLRKNG